MDVLRYMLKYGVDLLNNRPIRNWLDCGTLLGIDRSQKLLPWEKDVDIGVLKEELSGSNIKNLVDKSRELRIR